MSEIDLLLEARTARLFPGMDGATIETVYAAPGQDLVSGSKLLDLRINLSAVAAHDCPPVSFYRITLREPARLRVLDVRRGDDIDVGARLALFSTEQDDTPDQPATRLVRTATTGIIHHASLWDDEPA